MTSPRLPIRSALQPARRACAVGALAAATVAAACGERGADGVVSPAPTAARLQVINGARGPVDVLVGGRVRVSALPAATVSPALEVDSGSLRVEFRASGGSASATASAVVRAQASVTTLVAAQAAAGGALRAAALSDTTAVPAPGTAKLRVIHMAPNAPAIDLFYFHPAGSDSAYREVFPYTYGTGATYYSQQHPGPWERVIAPATPVQGGAAVSGVRARALATATGTLAAGDVCTVVVLDAPNGGVRLEAIATP